MLEFPLIFLMTAYQIIPTSLNTKSKLENYITTLLNHASPYIQDNVNIF